jgi:hypothetical protein
MEYITLEGQLKEYNGDYYEYRFMVDEGGGGINYFEKYDLKNDTTLSNYNIKEKLNLFYKENDFENASGLRFEHLGFFANDAIFKITGFDYMDDGTNGLLDYYYLSLNLETSELATIDFLPKLYEEDLASSFLLENFEDDYEIIPIYLKY